MNLVNLQSAAGMHLFSLNIFVYKVGVCVCVCGVRACVRACMRACVRACVRVCNSCVSLCAFVCSCMCVLCSCMHLSFSEAIVKLILPAVSNKAHNEFLPKKIKVRPFSQW